uniref:Uncharacterized protein n=1 Tax=Pseudellipsoidion edaphicum TaxID=1431838 RepID=A0A410D2V1_9STRA|nr:hypothetical protein Ycf60 [Pseudellipsoidion edaphicum]QAA12032.1 hypothetical protein Ycf60 [Pseudellipsoidion edaphicum]
MSDKNNFKNNENFAPIQENFEESADTLMDTNHSNKKEVNDPNFNSTKRKSLKLRKIFNKVRPFLRIKISSIKKRIRQKLRFLRKSSDKKIKRLDLKRSFAKVKNRLTRKNTLLRIKESKERFLKIKGFSSKQINLLITRSRKLFYKSQEQLIQKRLMFRKILFYIKMLREAGKSKIYRSFSELELVYLRTKKNIYTRIQKRYIRVKYQLDFILSNSNSFQSFKNKIIRIKLHLFYLSEPIVINLSKKTKEFIIPLSKKIEEFIINLDKKIEEFIINLNYDHEKTKEYVKRILFVFGMYSLPFLLLIKSFYACLIKCAQRGVTRFDWLIPDDHLKLILSDFSAGANYVPLRYIPKFLQSIETDFYIFLSYYTLFGTSKFSINKELIYHGVICVAHLIPYASMSLAFGIIISFLEVYIMFLKLSFYMFVLRNVKSKKVNKNYYKNYYKPRKAWTNRLLRRKYSPSYTELNIYGICGLNRLIRQVKNNTEIFVISNIFAPVSLIVIITLLYNCCYYIIYNKRPFIPVMTNFANRLRPNIRKDE